MLSEVVPHTNRYLSALLKLAKRQKLNRRDAEAYLLQQMRWSDKGKHDPVIGYVETDIDPQNRTRSIYEWLHTSKRTCAYLAAAAEAAGGRVVERVQPITVSINDAGDIAYSPLDGWTARKVYKVVIAW